MKDKYLIYTGLIIFIATVTFPFWYNLGKAAPAPVITLSEKALAAKTCVRSAEYMKTQHMQLLDDWRDSVVREGKRIYVCCKKCVKRVAEDPAAWYAKISGD